MQGLHLAPGMAESLADQFDKQTNLGKLQTDAQAAADREIVMVKWLRNELAKNSSLVIRLDYLSPANKDPKNPEFIKMKNDFIARLDRIIAERENNKFGPAFFPPVRAGSHTDLQHSEGWQGLALSISPDRNLPGGINLDKMGQMAQHQVGNVYDGFKINIDGYRRMLNFENDLNKRINLKNDRKSK